MPYKFMKIVLMMLFIFSSAAVANAADTYEQLKAEYGRVTASKQQRQVYTSLGDRFFRVYSSSPSSGTAADALLFAGKCYKVSFEQYGNTADREQAIKHLRTAYTNYDNDAAAEAYLESAEVFIMKNDLASAQFLLNRVRNKYPNSMQATAATSMLADLEVMNKNTGAQAPSTYTMPPAAVNTAVSQPSTAASAASTQERTQAGIDDVFTQPMSSMTQAVGSGGDTVITGIRYFSGSEYTRVVIDITNTATIDPHWLKADKSRKLPARLFIDVNNSTVDKAVSRDITIKDGLVSSVRWAYNKPGVTRIVLDSQSIEDFSVFQMANPNRIVIDVTGTPSKTPTVTAQNNKQSSSQSSQSGTSSNQTLASAFGLKIKTIVIDPGHGGKDPGATHFGLKEKDLVLDIAKQLRDLIKANNKDINVYLTRETDVFISLEERTAIANKHKADLFVSVHINASKNANARGIETYVLNVTNDSKALELAAFENQATTKSISDLQGILKDIMLSSKLEESLLLAGLTQSSLIKTLNFPQKLNLGVKQAPFYVLVGAQMPAILVESGFISNKEESAQLANAAYRKNIAKGIYNGINEYIKKYNK